MDIKKFFSITKPTLWFGGGVLLTLSFTYFSLSIGFDAQGEFNTVIDNLIGRKTAANFYLNLVNGNYDRAISYIFIGVGIFIFLFGSYHFLWTPGKEALRRHRSPNKFFFDDTSLTENMRSLANDIMAFVLEREAGMPHGDDRLNYISSDMKKAVKAHSNSQGNLVIGDDADDFHVRMIRNAQQERLRYEKQTITLFQKQYVGKVIAYLIDCRGRELLVGEHEKQLVVQASKGMLGRSFEFYRELVNLLNTCAERLHEISK